MAALPRLVAAALLPLLARGGQDAVSAAEVTLRAPRAFGYFIGDTFTHEATITLDPGTTLDPASLPRPGPVTYWLEILQVDLDDLGSDSDARRYRLHLRYQTFYAPLEPRMLSTPELSLKVVGGDWTSSLAVPAWPFLMSPLREIISTRAGASLALQPDATFGPHDLTLEQRVTAVAAGVASFALVALAWVRRWGPFRERHRPFGTAAREVASRLAATEGSEGYLAALLTLHRAFDLAAGRRLLADDLASFLESRPGFRGIAQDTARFFEASRQAFFGVGTESAGAVLTRADLASLAKRLAKLERAGA